MLQFQYSSLINAPVEQVWDFHDRPDILQQLTPPWQPVKVVRRVGGLGVGAVSEFQLWLGPIPVTWVAVHSECQPYRLFVDVQQRGPMVSWTHRHEFQLEGQQTRLSDRITFELPGGWLAELLLGWWVKARLTDMFRYRHQVTQRACAESTTNS